MDQLKIFQNEEFGKVRTITENGKIYFCGSDIAMALGYVRPAKAIQDHCKGILKRDIPTSGGVQKMAVISEGDIYRLVVKSQMPYADQFESWIFDEVIPSIRKHEMYATEELINNPDLLIAVATQLKEEKIARIRAEQKVIELKPKAEFFDTVADSKDAIEIGQVAKLIGSIGRNRLFELLRDKMILMNNNLPYQKFIDNGYFRVVEQKYTKPNGDTCINIKTLVYQRGVDYIRKLIA